MFTRHVPSEIWETCRLIKMNKKTQKYESAEHVGLAFNPLSNRPLADIPYMSRSFKYTMRSENPLVQFYIAHGFHVTQIPMYLVKPITTHTRRSKMTLIKACHPMPGPSAVIPMPRRHWEPWVPGAKFGCETRLGIGSPSFSASVT